MVQQLCTDIYIVHCPAPPRLWNVLPTINTVHRNQIIESFTNTCEAILQNSLIQVANSYTYYFFVLAIIAVTLLPPLILIFSMGY